MKTNFPAALLYEGKRWFSGIPVTLYGKPSSPNIIIKTEEKKKKDLKKIQNSRAWSTDCPWLAKNSAPTLEAAHL